jgi:ATP-dependent DNA helicase PIF1
MPGQGRCFLSIDKAVHDEDERRVPVEKLHSINSGSLPRHNLFLKDGCPVMLLRNIDSSRRLCNGTRLQVIGATGNLLRCVPLTQDGSTNQGDFDTHVLLPRIPCDSSEDDVRNIPLRRIQFPVKVCYAMTINKSQGQSLDHVGVLLDPPVFAHGQLYVAFGRVTAPDGLCLVVGEGDNHPPRGRLTNIVYPEAIHNV